MLTTIAGMEAMVAATLNFARDDAAVEPRRRTDLAALVASVVDDMSDAGMPVTLRPPDETVVIECQPTAMRRALTNLIDNAVKYGKRAEISLKPHATSVDIVIDDDGPGIPKEEQGKVLQPFYRLEQSRSRETGGMGLGLAIAQSAVQAHGGDLKLVNRPSGGLTAIIALPR
jgi:signal transduction histidine kinase